MAISISSLLPPMGSAAASAGESPVQLLLRAAAAIPLDHLLLAAGLLLLVALYCFFEIHLLSDIVSALLGGGGSVYLTFHPASPIYSGVAARCRSLRGRYWGTPWLASPHLQTIFLGIHGFPPSFAYRRQLHTTRDGGTIALDWLLASDVSDGSSYSPVPTHNSVPLLVVIPGLTSDSAAAYLKHVVYATAKHGWDVVVCNHRGLGGVSITSDCFYNAGWTEDFREVVGKLRKEHPNAPLFAVGTSIGANILVKYLGEEGENTPIAGAVAICSPWDLLICDRFITRKFVQRCYDKALAFGLKGYAKLHQPTLARLANWEGIRKSQSIRDFDHHATCVVAKYETVDTYYRRCSSACYVSNVSVPLLSVSALDDPLCTREAIPWDECRSNKNVVLATTAHGGHLAFFEGITARRLWWVRATVEFLDTLHNSPFMHGQKITAEEFHRAQPALESAIDKSPYVNFMEEEGMVAAVTCDNLEAGGSGMDAAQPGKEMKPAEKAPDKTAESSGHNELIVAPPAASGPLQSDKSIDCSDNPAQVESGPVASTAAVPEGVAGEVAGNTILKALAPIKRSLSHLARRQGRSLWLLAYIAIASSWPILGSLAFMVLRRRLKSVAPLKLRGN